MGQSTTSVAVVPARPYKPKDKAKAEVAVQVVERWILARLRHHIVLLPGRTEPLHPRPAGGSEQPALQATARLPAITAFEQLDKPALRPLPSQPYHYRRHQTREGQYRLPRAVQGAPLLGAPPVRGRAPGTARQRNARTSLLPAATGRHPPAPAPAGVHHQPRPHAQNVTGRSSSGHRVA